MIGDTVVLPTVGRQPPYGMPVLLGCSDRDPHIPVERVRETEAVMRALGAEVVVRIYPGHDHGINGDEMEMARQVFAHMAGAVRRAG